jgi:hypothetical protein
MPLVIHVLHAAPKPDLLNEEWMIVQNAGPGPLSAAGWTLEVGKKGQRPHPLGTLQPGFLLQPGERMRLITGTASKKAQGVPPIEEGLKNYHLFLREPVLKTPGLVLQFKLKQHLIASVTFDPNAPTGIAAA